ncbi:hypothetical protein [Streptomyces sp. NPDC007264]|uniref:hypothetical protein n=1 Tax=Streptomyces sp. NPDC007264 TaxID=3364777 RepID=UPI0036D94EB3
MTNATATTVDVARLVSAARELSLGGRWESATALLDAAHTSDPGACARLALAAAEVALERDWFAATSTAGERLRTAGKEWADGAGEESWDLGFLWLRHDYFARLRPGRDGVASGPDGKDPETPAGLRRRAEDLRDRAPDPVRGGWAEMYLGLIRDNLLAEHSAAPAHYARALRAGEVGDDLLAREALRHLGAHDHDAGDHARARERWQRATALGARAGTVPGTLTQQMLLAVLARATGDESGATALAREIARWAAAIGAGHIGAQAEAFLAGADPTAPTPER